MNCCSPRTTAEWLRVIRTDAVDSSGYMTPIMSDGPSCWSDELRQLSAHRHAGAAAHVIVVEEHREQPHVLARRFRFLVGVGPDLADRLLRRFRGAAIELDQPERFDFLRLAVLGHVEVGRLQVGDRDAVLVFRDDHVDAHEIDAGAEHRRLRLIGAAVAAAAVAGPVAVAPAAAAALLRVAAKPSPARIASAAAMDLIVLAMSLSYAY